MGDLPCHRKGVSYLVDGARMLKLVCPCGRKKAALRPKNGNQIGKGKTRERGWVVSVIDALRQK